MSTGLVKKLREIAIQGELNRRCVARVLQFDKQLNQFDKTFTLEDVVTMWDHCMNDLLVILEYDRDEVEKTLEP